MNLDAILKNSTQYSDSEEGSIAKSKRVKIHHFYFSTWQQTHRGKIILILITQLYFLIVEFICLNPAEENQLLQKLAKTPHAFSCVHMQTDRKGLPEPEIKESIA